MTETSPIRTSRVFFLTVFGVILISASAWFAWSGMGTNNLSGPTDILLGILAGISAFRFRRFRILIVVSTTFLFLGALEMAAYFYESNIASSPKNYSYEGDPPMAWFAEHPLVGYAFQGPARLWATATIDDEVLFDSVKYSIDSRSRRTCEPAVEALNHALFFGGSFAFGEGLPNSQMIACQFQAASQNEYESYNYAMLGWGPSQTYVQLGVDELFADIRQKSGIAVYSFIGPHINRATWNVGTSADFPEWPFFQLSSRGGLVGPMKARDRWGLRVATAGFKFLNGYSPLFRTLVDPSLIRIQSDEDAVLVSARVLAAARNRYRNRFNGEFFVLLWPRFRLDPKLEGLFVDEITGLGVPIVHIPKLPGDLTDAQIHSRDHHPSSKETTWVARSLLGEVIAMD